VNWTHAGVAPSLFPFLLRSENEIKVRMGSSNNWKGIKLSILKNRFKTSGNSARTLQNFWVKEFEKEGFLKITNTNPKGSKCLSKNCPCKTCNDPQYIYVKLSSIWQSLQAEFQLIGKDDDVYIESIGKLLTLSILAKESMINPQSLRNGGVSCGVTAVIPMMMILQEASINGNLVSREKCEEIYSKTKGIGRFSTIISHDNSRTNNQRIFEKDDGDNIEIKQEAIRAFKLVQTQANNLYTKLNRGNVII